MKKIILACLTITIIGIACNKPQIDNSIPAEFNIGLNFTRGSCEFTSITTPFANNNLESNLDLLGRMHNECLENYFTQAQLSGLTKDDQPAFDEHLRNTLKNFNESKGIIINEGGLYSCINSNSVLYEDDKYQTDFSTESQTIINSVVTLLNDETKTSADYVAGLNSLQILATNLTIEKEKIPILCMIKVSLRSVEYWNAHLNEWVIYFGGKKTRMSKLGKIGLSDGIGALRGGILGFVAGGPVTAFAGALCGAGCNSVMRGLMLGFTGH